MATLSDYRDRPHWSFSSLNQFFNICSLQYAFERVYRLQRAFTPATLSFGSAFHRVMEWAALERMQGHTPQPGPASELFQDVWARQLQEDTDISFGGDGDADTMAGLGRGMCACAVTALDPDEQVIRVCEAFCVPLTLAGGGTLETPLIGEIDCVTRKAGRTTLVDWKTAGRKWPRGKADADWQPTAFIHGYSIMHGLTPDFRFDIVTKAGKPVCESQLTTRTPDDFTRLAGYAELAERMIASEHFHPNEHAFFCGSCPFREPCRNWHKMKARTAVRMAA